MALFSNFLLLFVFGFVNFTGIQPISFCFPGSNSNLITTCKKSHMGVFFTTHPVNDERKVGVYWYTDKRIKDNELLIYARGKTETRYISSNQGYILSSLTVGDDILNEELGEDPFKRGHNNRSFFAKWFDFESTTFDTHPTWMADRKDFLGGKRLNDIFIPGTHNSAAYNYLNHPFPHLVLRWKGPYEGSTKIFYQNEKILYQLIFGARYLDIRPIHIGDEFFCASPDIRLPFESLASEVRQFLNKTQEIIILGLSGFLKFKNKSIHEKFIEYLKIQFSGYIIEKSDSIGWQSNLTTLWATGRKLIISYDDPIAKDYSCIWEPVQKISSDTNEICFLQGYLEAAQYLSRKNLKESSPPTVVEAALQTPMPREGLPEKLSYHLTIEYLTNEKLGHSANIVAVNFLLSTGIVDAAIEWNEKRYKFLKSEGSSGKRA